MNKVVIVGCGNVGMAYAYCMVSGNDKIDELVLVDINLDKAEGEALDLKHASSCSNHKICIKYANDYRECDNASIVCIAAGKNQEVGESRTDLIHKNLGVFKSIISQINNTKFNGIYLIATNPLDVMTYVTLKLSHFEPKKVIGSGTTLDTARLQYLIGHVTKINPRNIHAYVIGEHGDSEMIPWSVARVGLNPATQYLSKTDMNNITFDVRNSAYDIIKKKGNTAYGIGMCLNNITNAIFSDENTIYTVSAYNKKYGICVGLPCIINKHGIEKSLDLMLTDEENTQLNNSCLVIKQNINQIENLL